MGVCPQIQETSFGWVVVGGVVYEHDIYILPDGSVHRRDRTIAAREYGTFHLIGPVELQLLCRTKPKALFIGTGQSGTSELLSRGRELLARLGIELWLMPTWRILYAYNESIIPKAALLHVTC